ncbi:hypothetical protein MNBD_ALPHA12-2101, partial [hydrothermal vent metagenome]
MLSLIKLQELENQPVGARQK